MVPHLFFFSVWFTPQQNNFWTEAAARDQKPKSGCWNGGKARPLVFKRKIIETDGTKLLPAKWRIFFLIPLLVRWVRGEDRKRRGRGGGSSALVVMGWGWGWRAVNQHLRRDFSCLFPHHQVRLWYPRFLQEKEAELAKNSDDKTAHVKVSWQKTIFQFLKLKKLIWL